MNISLVMCGKRKRRGLHKARNLYFSERFKKDFEEASKISEKVFILSAKHILLKPESWVWNYDRELEGLPTEERALWAERVFRSITKISIPQDSIHFFADSEYYKELKELLDKAGHKTFVH